MAKCALVLGFVIGALACGLAEAQPYPSKYVRIIVPAPAGGSVDALARLIGSKMQESMKTAVLIENRPGAGGNVAASMVAKSASDGHVILYNTVAQAITPATYRTPPWTPDDFIPVTQIGAANFVVVVNNEVPVKTLRELVALSRSKPGVLNYASTGPGNPLSLTMELLKLRTGIDVSTVAFRGDAEIVNALQGNIVQISILPIATGKVQVDQGLIRALGVTDARRTKDFDIATVAEQGVPGFAMSGWNGFFVPAKTPVEIVDRIYSEAKKALDTPDIRQKFESFSTEPIGSTPAEFSAFYSAEVDRFKKIVADAKIPLQE